LWLLSGGGGGEWNIGDTRVLLCALAYAAHMVVLGGAGRKHDVQPLTLVQLATVAGVTGVISLLTEPRGMPRDGGVWAALVLTGVFASAVAYAIQTYAQRFLSPAKTALILIMEPVFGGVFGWFAGERLGTGGLAGSALILVGMFVAEVVGARTADDAEVALEPSIEGPPLIVEEDGP
jgi:drug/metabolite transporter (DMT)-like permease